MAKLPRKQQKLFAVDGAAIGVYGSAQAATPTLTGDVETVQSLAAWLQGWNDATIDGDKRPPLEEFNGINFVNTYQLSYVFQEGIPEYNAATEYHIESIVKETGTGDLYVSITDDNIGNALSDVSNWELAGNLKDLRDANKLEGVTLNAPTPSNGDVLKYDSGPMEWVSYSKSNAAMYFTNNATVTTIAVQDTPVIINATYTPEELVDFTHVSGRLTYTGTATKKFRIEASVSIESPANNTKMTLYAAENGAISGKSGKSVIMSSSTEVENVCVLDVIELATNDYIEIFVENNSGTNDIVVEDLYTLITEL
jgi:hypothetical protein